MGRVIALGVMILLTVLPVGIQLRYNADGLRIKVILGLIRITVLPLPKKKKKKLPEQKASASAQAAEEDTLPKPPQPPAQPVEKKPKTEKGGSVLDFLPLVKAAVDFLGDFRRKLRLDRLYLRLVMAGDDPCDLAVNYGRAWAAVGNLMPRLEKWFVIKKRDIGVACDFTASETRVIAHLDLTITLGRLLAAAGRFSVRALLTFLKIKNKRKGGAVK